LFAFVVFDLVFQY